nr:hypothetical protein [Lysinibacillus sphaericus]
MRENLFFRTETLPEEIPILFTNENLYKNFNVENIEQIFSLENSRSKVLTDKITVPYFFLYPRKIRNTEKWHYYIH